MLGASCSRLKNSSYEEYLSLKYEIPECDTSHTYTSTVSVTGTAKFFKRGVNLVVESVSESGSPVLRLKNMTQGDPLANALPIQYAEVGVYDSANNEIQCGQTNSNGELKALDGVSNLEIPNTAGQYSVRVYARMNASLSKLTAHVAVKQDKYTNEVFFISSTINSNGVDDPNVELVAYARQTDSTNVEGGAFNILNSLYASYKYINDNTGTTDVDCLNDKLNVYWKAGFNPGQYVYPEKSPSVTPVINYYDKSINSLFISGGRLGNISFEPAAHFDDYVIIHEFGHHVENVCGSLLSPGGSHSVIVRTDPRLAWAEGWANYFAGQVMYSSIATINPEFTTKMSNAGITNTAWTYFFASDGFSDSVQNIGSGSGFMFDLKKSGNNPDSWQMGEYIGQAFDKVDPSLYPGEGHFREGAVSRGLFKLSNVCGSQGTCITASPITFEEIWKSMNKITGIGQSLYKFKSSAEFMEILKGHATWDAAKKTFNEASTSEALHIFTDGIFTSGGANIWMPYATQLTTTSSSSCSSGVLKIEPRSDDPVLTGTNSDTRYSNHFYTISLNVLNSLDEIYVTFTHETGSQVEFDLLLYTEDYVQIQDYTCSSYNSNDVCVGSYTASRGTNSSVVRSDRRAGSLTTKSIKTLSSLDSSQQYLLNIRAYTPNKSISSNTLYSYTIKDQNGDNICP